MNGLRPGGLALIIRWPWSPSLNPEEFKGRCVETVKLLAPDEVITTPDGGHLHNWSPIPLWYIIGDVKTEFLSGRIVDGFALLRPTYLIPLNGDPDEGLTSTDDSRRLVVVRALPEESRRMLPVS